jgi:hypothetical protein
MYERKDSVLEFPRMRATQVESPQDVARWISTPWKWCGRYALDLIIEAGERLARTDTHRAALDDMRRRRITLGDYA